MEIIRERVNIKLDSKYLKNEKEICFLDIETLGLRRDYDAIYLIGFLYKDGDDWILEQVWISSLDKESELLDYSLKLISNFEYIVNYNGSSFDLPYINHRAKLYNLDTEISMLKSFDIYSLLRSNKDVLKLDNLKLETVEEYLGIYREDIYSGLECIYMYKDFLKTNDTSSKSKILQHNYDDLIYLSEILTIVDRIFDKKSIRFNYQGNDNIFLLEKLQTRNNSLLIEGSIINNNIKNTVHFMNDYKLIIDDNNRFTISIEVYDGRLGEDIQAKFTYKENFQIKKSANFNNYGFNVSDSIIMLEIDGRSLDDNLFILIYLILNLSI